MLGKSECFYSKYPYTEWYQTECFHYVYKLNTAILSVSMPSVIMLNVIMLNVIMLNVIMLNVIMLNVIMLNVIVLNVIMLNIILLNAIMLKVMAPNGGFQTVSRTSRQFVRSADENEIKNSCNGF